VLEDARPDAETDKLLKRLELRLGQLRAATKPRAPRAAKTAAKPKT
jgi:hypothetical protein